MSSQFLIAKTFDDKKIYATEGVFNQGSVEMGDGIFLDISLLDYFFQRQDVEKIEDTPEQKKFWKNFLNPDYIGKQWERHSTQTDK